VTLKLEQVKQQEFEAMFSCLKQGIFPYVEAVFGWDDIFQRERIMNNYELAWFHWVYRDGDRVGMVCFKEYDNALHVHFLILEEQYQSQGLGKALMEQLEKQARHEELEKLTLSSFICNSRAVAFYQSIGYQITESDEHFHSLTLPLK